MPNEIGSQGLEDSKQGAKDKMKEVFEKKGVELGAEAKVVGPRELKPEYADHSLDEELKRRDDKARADIVAIDKEGRKITTMPAGMDKEAWDAVKAVLDQAPRDGHLTTSRLQGAEKIGKKDYYFVSVYDRAKNSLSYFCKEGSDFIFTKRDFVENLDDKTY